MNAPVQLNTRVSPDIASAVQVIANGTQLPIRLIIEDAILYYGGKVDDMREARRKMAVQALTPAKVKRAA